MAEQMGTNPLRGSIGNITYYKRNGKYLAKTKSSFNKKDPRNDLSSILPNKYRSEFGHCSSFGKLIRYSISQFIKSSKDINHCERLMSLLENIVKTDKISALGERRLYKADLTLLKGFDFNLRSGLDNFLSAKYDITIDRSTGKFRLQIPPFEIQKELLIPKNAQFFKINLTATEIDSERDDKKNVDVNSGFIGVNDILSKDIDLSVSLGAGSLHPFIVTMNVQFFEEVNGELLHMRGREHNPMQIVEVNQ